MSKKRNKNKKEKDSVLFIIGVSLAILGIILISFSFFNLQIKTGQVIINPLSTGIFVLIGGLLYILAEIINKNN